MVTGSLANILSADPAGNVLAAELVDRAAQLCEKLAEGYLARCSRQTAKNQPRLHEAPVCRKHHEHAERFDSRHCLPFEEISWYPASSVTDWPCALRRGYSIWTAALLDHFTELEALWTLHETEQIS